MVFPRLARRAPRDFWTDESGATAVEYAGLLMLIGVVLLTAVTAVGSRLSGVFNGLSAKFTAMGF